jgi:hypothetical protein
MILLDWCNYSSFYELTASGRNVGDDYALTAVTVVLLLIRCLLLASSHHCASSLTVGVLTTLPPKLTPRALTS